MSEPTRPLRIALATDWYLPRLGGIEVHVADLAGALRERGHAASVITSTPAAGVEPHDRDVVRVGVARLPGAGIAISPRLQRRLREAIGDGGHDVVHAHASVVSPVAYASVLAARALGLPAVVTFHSVLHASARALALLDALLAWRRWPVTISAVSTHVADQLRAAMPGLEVAVLPNGVHAPAWGSVGRRSGDGDGDGVHVVSAMRLHRKKRPMALLRSFARARQAAHGTGMRLTIFGDGPERSALERTARRLGVADCVRLPGRVGRNRLVEVYATAQLFALPTTREAFGLAALEARCAGLPVVAMRPSGVTDFLEHDDNALLARDDDELATHLARLATDAALRTRIAASTLRTRQFDWSVVAAQHVACYAHSSRSAGPLVVS